MTCPGLVPLTLRATPASNFYYDLLLRYFLPTALVPPRDEGFTVVRKLTTRDGTTAVSGGKVGQILHGHLTVVVPVDRQFVAVEDFIPAGTELVNLRLDTEDASLAADICDDWNCRWYDHSELRDDRLFLFSEQLAAGTYEYDYYLRVLTAGEFAHLPARAWAMYTPEVWGRTGGGGFVGEK